MTTNEKYRAIISSLAIFVVGTSLYSWILLGRQKRSAITGREVVADNSVNQPNNEDKVGVVPVPRTPFVQRILVATRLHLKESSSMPEMNLLDDFITRALKYGDSVAIAVGCEGNRGLSLLEQVRSRVLLLVHDQEDLQSRIHIIPVQPWGKFVNALNALAQHALETDHSHVLFQSFETGAAPESVAALKAEATESDLVVGAALTGHTFNPGWNDLTGRTCPWNTLALWNTRLLALTGFLAVAEGLEVPDRADAGVEEVSCVALLQRLHTEKQAGAKLVKVPGLEWKTDFGDDERRRWHERKMVSKDKRPADQMKRLGHIGAGRVFHLVAPTL